MADVVAAAAAAVVVVVDGDLILGIADDGFRKKCERDGSEPHQ